MRLIDADKLEMKILYDDSWELEYQTEGVFDRDIKKAPTVEAIPCEWVINKANELHQYAFGTPENDDDYYKRCIANNDAKALNRVLHLWREENDR